MDFETCRQGGNSAFFFRPPDFFKKKHGEHRGLGSAYSAKRRRIPAGNQFLYGVVAEEKQKKKKKRQETRRLLAGEGNEGKDEAFLEEEGEARGAFAPLRPSFSFLRFTSQETSLSRAPNLFVELKRREKKQRVMTRRKQHDSRLQKLTFRCFFFFVLFYFVFFVLLERSRGNKYGEILSLRSFHLSNDALRVSARAAWGDE